MLTDRELRREFEAALEEVTPPAPWLSTSIEKAWRAAEQTNRRRRAWLFSTDRPVPRLRALIAVLLVLAIIVSVVVGSRVLHMGTSPIPAGPGVSIPGLLKVTSQCSWRFPGSPQMFSASVGWTPGLSQTGVGGPYRTTDGGGHWTNVAPPPIPNETPFSLVGAAIEPWQFLDGSDAWVVRIGGSPGVHADHVIVFSTNDGGASWRQSQPVELTPAHPDDFIQAAICFIDPQDGFLAMGSGPLVQPGQVMTASALYKTSDGGLHWQYVSDPDVQARQAGLPCVFAAMSFSSAQDGFIYGNCTVLFVTHDGGATWLLRNAATVTVAYFFDATHGVVEDPPSGSQSPFRYPISTSSDGGLTWETRGVVPISNCIAVFVDPVHGWCIVNPGSVNPSAGTPTDAEVYRTVDGGHSWSLTTRMGTNGAVIALNFISASVGFLAIGGNPAEGAWEFFTTTNAGSTWKQVRSSVNG